MTGLSEDEGWRRARLAAAAAPSAAIVNALCDYAELFTARAAQTDATAALDEVERVAKRVALSEENRLRPLTDIGLVRAAVAEVRAALTAEPQS